MDPSSTPTPSTVACALCREHKALRRSHIIPNAVFRKIKQAQGSGQLIAFDDAQGTLIEHSQDTWWEYLLCNECERIISGYERYGLELLCGGGHLVKGHAGGVNFMEHDFRQFKLFLTSLLWRAAVSRQASFSRVLLTPWCCEEARRSLLLGNPLKPLRLGCKLQRLVDPTPKEHGGFSIENLQQLIVSPVPRLHSDSCYSVVFVMRGFLLEFFVRAIPFRFAGQRGVHTNTSTLFVPNQSVLDVPELMKVMAAGYAKSISGHVTPQIRNRKRN